MPVPATTPERRVGKACGDVPDRSNARACSLHALHHGIPLVLLFIGRYMTTVCAPHCTQRYRQPLLRTVPKFPYQLYRAPPATRSSRHAPYGVLHVVRALFCALGTAHVCAHSRTTCVPQRSAYAHSVPLLRRTTRACTAPPRCPNT